MRLNGIYLKSTMRLTHLKLEWLSVLRGVNEDSDGMVHAGQFATVLDVNSPDEFLNSIKTVMDSGQDLAIIVQQMKKGKFPELYLPKGLILNKKTA